MSERDNLGLKRFGSLVLLNLQLINRVFGAGRWSTRILKLIDYASKFPSVLITLSEFLFDFILIEQQTYFYKPSKTKNFMKTRGSLSVIELVAATLPIAISTMGCTTKLDVSQHQKNLTAGVNGFLNNQLREVVREIQREARTKENPNGPPAVIEDVGLGDDNFPEVLQAHELGRGINLIYHSSGPNNAPEFLKKCQQHGIIIDRLFLTDPTRTYNRDFPIPDNVLRVDVYFSTVEDVLTMAFPFARGNPNKFDTTDPRIHVHYLKTNHLNMPRNLKKEIKEMMLAPSSSRYSLLSSVKSLTYSQEPIIQRRTPQLQRH